jgi:hypothetical protein
MNYEFYIKENSPVMIINDVLDTVYFNEEYDVGCDWNGKIPEDIMMKLLIFGYMNGAYSSRSEVLYLNSSRQTPKNLVE